MSERTNHDLDAQLDRALSAIVARADAPADLYPRVMARIGAPSRNGRPASATRPSWLGFPVGLLARPALAVAAVAALLTVAVLAVWVGGRPDPEPLVATGGRATPAASPRAHAAPRATPPDAPGEPSDATAAGTNAHVGTRVANTRVSRTRWPGMAEPWALALPPLDPPEPIELEPIEELPMRVARLEVERLSIDPLELDALERSEEE
jgi:hypothetical protein